MHRAAHVIDAAARRAADVVFESDRLDRTSDGRQQALDFGIVDGADFVGVIEVRYRSLMVTQFETLTIERQTLDDRAPVMNWQWVRTVAVPIVERDFRKIEISRISRHRINPRRRADLVR